MRRAFESRINKRRRGIEKIILTPYSELEFSDAYTIPTLYNAGGASFGAWSLNSANFDSGYLRCTGDGAYAASGANLIPPGPIWIKFAIACWGQGSGNDQHYVFIGGINSGYGIGIYIRQYSSSFPNNADNRMTFAVRNSWGGDFAYNDASVIWNSYAKYSFWTTAGTWYWISMEWYRTLINIKLWQAGTVEPVTWDYSGSVITNNSPTCEGPFVIYSALTSGNGMGCCGLEFGKLGI
jgi:hypothetical protein